MTEASTAPVALWTWNIPRDGTELPVTVHAITGQITTIVGANGAGKSALGAWMDQTSGVRTQRLIAHRRLWFQHAGPEISPAQRQSSGKNIGVWSKHSESRYVDHADSARASIALFDLLAMVNDENRRMVDLFREGSSREQVDELVGLPLLERLNRVLAVAGLPIQLEVAEGQLLNARNVVSGATYPIFQMSDGEKSALLLAAEVLSTQASTVLIIDEPERHLHRSISAGLVDAIIEDRPDCHFIVLSHDLELAAALASRPGQTLAVSGCTWAGTSPVGWHMTVLEQGAEIPETARRAILGGRRDILFVEGDPNSHDSRLYRLLFPAWGIYPAGGADQVIRSVTGLRDSEKYHWLRAEGIVDGDVRTEAEIASLRDRGILALGVSEVENIYYLDVVIGAVAKAQARALDRDFASMLSAARGVALETLGSAGTLERLALKAAAAVVRRRVLDVLPSDVSPDVGQVEVSVPSPYADILSSAQLQVTSGDWDALVKGLPIRDTPARGRVANMLGYQNAAAYESAARVLMRDNPSLADAVRSVVGQVGQPTPVAGT